MEVDRTGDRVYPEWNLEHFKLNPIALAFHKHDKPVGVWENIRIVGTQLLADLKLAKTGTSGFIDEVRSLVEQGVLKATSIGFKSANAVANSFGGLDLKDNYLLEVSLVSVPAQQYALRKSLSKYISSDELDRLCSVSGNCPIKSSEDNTSVTAKTSTSPQIKTIKGSIMTIAERIKGLQESMTAKQAELAGLNGQAELTDVDVATMARLSTELAADGERLKSFEAMEKQVAPAQAKAVVSQPKVEAKDAAKAVLKGLVATTKAAIEGKNVATVLNESYKGEKAVATMVKAATEPALTSTDAWAGALVRDGYESFLADLLNDTIFGKVPCQSVTFGKFGSLSLPFRTGTDDLSGAFIEEGAPIPVKATAYNTIKINPFKLGVISVFSKEMFRKSIPNIEVLIKEAIQNDTANLIDKEFLSATAASALRPAGIEASAGAANIVASAGSDVGSILTDFNGVFDRLTNAKLGGGGTILMHPSRLRGLKLKTDALGNFVFKDLAVLSGFGIETSINVPADKVYVIDEKAMIKGVGIGIEFETNSSAALVMADPADPIVDGAGKVTGSPVRSLFQTDSTAVRMVMELSWLQARANGVQILTGVSY
jgi:HK97 family phage major capsid protein